MRVVYPSGEIDIDFLTRRLKNTTPYEVKVDIAADLPDPLGAADEGFYAACLGLGHPLVQARPDVFRRIRIAPALVAGDQDATRHHARDTRQPDPLPDTAHSGQSA